MVWVDHPRSAQYRGPRKSQILINIPLDRMFGTFRDRLFEEVEPKPVRADETANPT